MIPRMLIFGATGDLVTRLLLRGIAELLQANQLPGHFSIVASARPDMTTGDYRRTIARDLAAHAPHVPEETRDALVGKISYEPGDATDAADVGRLVNIVSDAGAQPFVAYLALPQGLFASTIESLSAAGLPAGSRIVVEKPFGESVQDARELNALLARAAGDAGERAIFRVDHVLGMGTLQNLPAFRFANRAIDAIWSSEHIAQVDILWEEDLALEGRATFYDKAGALKDVVQNHVTQVLCYMAMEPQEGDEDIADRRLAVLKAVQTIEPDQMADRTRRGRYTAGDIHGRRIPSYVDEPGVDPARDTETWAEIVLEIDTDRWRGTRFVLRAGKALRERRKMAIVHFRPSTHEAASGAPANQLMIGIDDPFDIRLVANGHTNETPGELLEIFLASPPLETELFPYAHVIRNILDGGTDLSVRGDEAEESWRIFEPVVRAWEEGAVPMEEYPAGSSGPPPKEPA